MKDIVFLISLEPLKSGCISILYVCVCASILKVPSIRCHLAGHLDPDIQKRQGEHWFATAVWVSTGVQQNQNKLARVAQE